MSLRVFELAKELNIPTKELIKRIKIMGIEISGNFSALTAEQTTDIRKNFLEPATRIKESVVAGEEGPKKVRRRIISAKKATEGRKIKKSLMLEDVPLEKDVETRKQMSAEDDKDADKKLKNITQKKTAAPVDDVSEESKISKADTKEKVVQERMPARDIRRRIMKAAQKAAEPKVIKPAETKDQEKSAEIATVDNKPSAKKEAVGKETIKQTKTKKAVSQIDKKQSEVVGKDKEQPDKKGKKPDVDAGNENRKPAKDNERRDKPKIEKKIIPNALDEMEGELASSNLPSARPGKFIPNKRFSKSTKRKDRNRKQKDVRKEVHTFNPRQKDLVVGEFITVGDLAGLIGVRVPQIIKTLMSLNIMATITQSIDGETAVLVAGEHDVELKVEFQSIEDGIDQIVDKTDNLQLRPPVVTIMGHVDHGKTSLLDKIRSTTVIGGEAGGITQHIGAYHVKTDAGQITFLDTPGHEAFTAMRARGADVTDIVVLVVAADDGPRPQTVEAIDHAKAAGVQMIVAINKCDKPDANPERTIQKLMEYELVPEEFGGDVPMINVSAKSGVGIDKLLEMIHLQSEVLELTADPDRLAQGVVIESKVDKGRGNTATILIQTGTLRVGDNYVVGTEYGRVRAMWNDHGKKLHEASPSVPVEIVGLNGVPMAGDRFNVGTDEKQVRQIATLRSEKEKVKKQALQQKRSLENLMDSMGNDEQRILNLIIKTDVIGSLEALSDALHRLGNEQVAIRVIRGAVGAITSTDVLLAATSDAVVIGFNTRPDPTAKKLAGEENVDIRMYSIIYEVIDDVKKAHEGMLEPIIREEIQGKAEVLEIFNIPKVGVIAGTKVTEGKFIRDCPVRVIRDNVIIHDGKLSSLKRFKDQAKEVLSGFECGIGVESYKDIRVGDELESYLRLETAAKL
ncbi:MAG: translation initiation factor IF-2 [SAR324 cluster bacterium]|nr:translation initiation factor IF-2 [SAR324 cluster bacterium]